MKALTLWPEYSHAIGHLGKRIENRDWPAPWMLGKRFAIHAGAHIGGRKSKVATLEGLEAVAYTAIDLGLEVRFGSVRPRFLFDGKVLPVVTSAVICTAVLARCERNPHPDGTFQLADPPPPWANPVSRFWWHLEDVEVLPEPIPAIGKQGFWEWTR